MNPSRLSLHPHKKDLGGGFVVRRLLPAAARQAVGPFLFFDHFGPIEVRPDEQHDVRPHPHIGLATVTYLFEGAMLHRDSTGAAQPRPAAVGGAAGGRRGNRARLRAHAGAGAAATGDRRRAAGAAPRLVELRLVAPGAHRAGRRRLGGAAFGRRAGRDRIHPAARATAGLNGRPTVRAGRRARRASIVQGWRQVVAASCPWRA
jgi:hypothetical protein